MKDSIAPGLILAIAVTLISMLATFAAGNILPWDRNPLSPLLVAIVLGMLIRTFVSVPESFEPGIAFGVKKLLRFGIILMGIRLSIFSVLKIGVSSLLMIVACIGAALLVATFIARRLGIGEKLGVLIAAGTSICGVSAIVATSPGIGAKEEETAYAVGTITIFGILATIAYPYLVHLVLGLPVEGAGFFLGTSIHDTSQVTAAGMVYDQLWSLRTETGITGADIAVTTKLVRNTFMIVVIPLLIYLAGRKKEDLSGGGSGIMRYVPLFVLGYIAMGIVRTLGDRFLGPGNETWFITWQSVKSVSTYVIAVAVTCIGLGTDVRKLSKLGYKPFLCGLAAALSVGAVSWLLVRQLGRFTSV
jgi:uncharacterized integral membrane protein (TIGR00698 family)